MQDVTIHITGREGKKHTVLAPTDRAINFMGVVRSLELAPEGTIAIFGGMVMCASCQYYVNSEHELNEKGDEEDAMLSEAFNVKPNSRLSCQIPITEPLNELEIELAPEY